MPARMSILRPCQQLLLGNQAGNQSLPLHVSTPCRTTPSPDLPRVASQSVSEVRRCQGCRMKERPPVFLVQASRIRKRSATSPVPILLLWLLPALEFNCCYCWVLCIFKKTKKLASSNNGMVCKHNRNVSGCFGSLPKDYGICIGCLSILKDTSVLSAEAAGITCLIHSLLTETERAGKEVCTYVSVSRHIGMDADGCISLLTVHSPYNREYYVTVPLCYTT